MRIFANSVFHISTSHLEQVDDKLCTSSRNPTHLLFFEKKALNVTLNVTIFKIGVKIYHFFCHEMNSSYEIFANPLFHVHSC